MKILSAAEVSRDDLRVAMNDAFSDYAVPMVLSSDQFRQMMMQRGLAPAASRVAVIDGRIAALWLVSVRDRFAYLVSSGTRTAYRSRGLARRLGLACLDGLKIGGAGSLQLEVLAENGAAIGFYAGLGLTVRRRLDCYAVPLPDTPAGDTTVMMADWASVADEAGPMRDWDPTWQNSDLSAAAVSDQLICATVYQSGRLRGYALSLSASPTLLQIAVAAGFRRQGLATALLSAILARMPEAGLRVLNVQNDDRAFAGFMASMKASRTVQQLEMYRTL